MLIIYKKPKFENDDALFLFKNVFIKNIFDICNDDYLKWKDKKFFKFDYKKSKYKNKFMFSRPSFRFYHKIKDFKGSIYTHTIFDRNNIKYKKSIELIKSNIKKNGRRNFVRFSNSLLEYSKEEIDASCLSFIHYLSNSVKIAFRASDIENEFIYDFLTIYKYFISPIYNFKINISFYLSTVQNYKEFLKILNFIKEKIYE